MMIIRKIFGKCAFQMLFIQYDYMVKALFSYTSDDPFDIWVLPGTSRCFFYFNNVHIFYTIVEYRTTNAVSISQKVFCGFQN